ANLAAMEALSDRPAGARDNLVELGRAQIAQSGTVQLQFVGFVSLMGFTDDAYDLIEAASFAHLHIAGHPASSASGSPHTLFDAQNSTLRDDQRFVALCARLGLCRYWIGSRRWPDCADQVPYDFRAEARRLAA
ncbi:MAG TPA: hypothetical protein VFE03_12005, partial [Caulobacteraceae bacterium]|nr:hypothetical protein [Caulobacteraceae bacterium]